MACFPGGDLLGGVDEAVHRVEKLRPGIAGGLDFRLIRPSLTETLPGLFEDLPLGVRARGYRPQLEHHVPGRRAHHEAGPGEACVVGEA